MRGQALRRGVLALLLLLALAQPARGAELEEALGVPELKQAAEGYLESYLGLEEREDFTAGSLTILEESLDQLPGILRQAGRGGLLLLAVVLLCTLAGTLGEKLGGGGLDPGRLVGAAAVTAVAMGDVTALLGLGRETLERLEQFSLLLLPVATGACAASGHPAAAAARQGASLLFLDLFTAVGERVVAPVIYAYVAAAPATAALDNEGLGRLAGFLKWGATALLTGLFTAFVFCLTVTGALGDSADALTQKAAKTALSGLVPVVGSILSDAAGTVAAGAGVLRGTVGVLGLLTVLAICILPFLRLGVHYLVYRLTAALCATVCSGPEVKLIDDIGSAFALLLGLVGGGGLILYVSLIAAVKGVAA